MAGRARADSRAQNLDVQYTIGVATGVPTTFITVGDDSQSDNFLDTINELIKADAPPQVLTTSYGEGESDAGADLAECVHRRGALGAC